MHSITTEDYNKRVISSQSTSPLHIGECSHVADTFVRCNPHRFCAIAFAIALCTPYILSGQTFSFGVVGGASITSDFRTTHDSGAVGGIGYTTQSYSDPGRFIIGPMVEIGLGDDWAIEANALHRAMQYTEITNLPGQPPRSQGSISAWEFPILLKYRFRARGLRPFVTAGPSFRAYDNPGGAAPSHYGITAGTGVDFTLNHLRFSPTVRYTHWGDDGLPFRPTIRNQVEALVEAQYTPISGGGHSLPSKLWLGVVFGVPLTNDFPPPPIDTPQYTGSSTRSADFRFAAGLVAEVELSGGWSIDANGLYRRLHFRDSPEVVVTWEIPVFAKYRFSRSRLAPFVEGGPSFRPTGNLNNADPSHYGFAVGAGVDARITKIKLTPTLRYTRWANDNRTPITPQAFTKRDQLELLVGFSF